MKQSLLSCCFSSQCPQPLPFLAIQLCLSWTFRIKGIIWHVTSLDWHLSLSGAFSSSVHAGVCIRMCCLWWLITLFSKDMPCPAYLSISWWLLPCLYLLPVALFRLWVSRFLSQRWSRQLFLSGSLRAKEEGRDKVLAGTQVACQAPWQKEVP